MMPTFSNTVMVVLLVVVSVSVALAYFGSVLIILCHSLDMILKKVCNNNTKYFNFSANF